MDKDLHDIEDLFRRGLEDNEEIPPLNTWNRIDNILDKDKVISIYKKYARLKWVAILLVFFLAGLSMYVWNNRENNNPENKNSAILEKEVKPKNNADPSYRDNQIDLKNPVDSINSTAYNNQKPAKEISHTKIDKNILKKQPEKM